MQFGLGVSALEKLSDVDLTGLGDGDLLVYNNSTEVWEAVAPGGGGPHAIGSHTDTDLTGYTNDHIIKFNSSSGKWESVLDTGGGGAGLEQDVIGFTIYSNNNVTTGAKAFREIPWPCDIIGWHMVVDTTASNECTVSVQKTTDYSAYDEVITVEGDKPQINNEKTSEDFTLTNWDIDTTKDEILRFTVDSATNVTQMHLFLTIERNVP